MKTDPELAALLRATMAGRADSVSSARVWHAPSEPPRRSRWPAALAAAAAVIAVVAGVALGVRLTRSAPPARPPGTAATTDSPRPTPTPTPTPTCSAALPQAWRAALHAAALPAGGRTADALSVAPDGSVLAIRDDGVHPGDGRAIVSVRPGRAAQVLYAIPNPDDTSARSADVYDHWLAAGLVPLARPARGVVPGDTPDVLSSVVVVDLDSHIAHVLATSGPAGHGPVITAEVEFEGTVYWDERASYAASSGVVKAHDLRSGTTRTVYRGSDGTLEITPEGVRLDTAGGDHLIRAVPVPAPVADALAALGRSTLSTDGTAYAWQAAPDAIGWWAPGHDAPVYRRLTQLTGSSDITVYPAGRFVMVLGAGGSGSGTRLVDVLSGATAAVPDSAYGTAQHPDIYLAHGGVFAGLAFVESGGHWVDGYWADAARTPVRVDTATLPGLRC